MFARYALFYTPRPCPFADFGAAWLGWDVAKGVVTQHLNIDSFDLAEITNAPRKYGLHGTIKPPFRLADGRRLEDLQIAVAALCDHLPPVKLAGLDLVKLGRFLALCPVGDTAALNHVAAQVVKQLDGFRAPASEDELARRRSANLTPKQSENLRHWGYPYVMDSFRFHITLTGRLDNQTLAEVELALDPLIKQLLPAPFVIDSLTLVGQRDDGMFEEINRYPLRLSI